MGIGIPLPADEPIFLCLASFSDKRGNTLSYVGESLKLKDGFFRRLGHWHNGVRNIWSRGVTHVIAIFYSSTLRRSWQSRLVPPEAKMSFWRSPVSAFANGNMIVCWCSQSNNERLMSTYYLSADLQPCTFGDTSTVHACQVRSSRERFGSHRLTTSVTTAVATQIPTVIPLTFLPPDLRRD